MKKSFLFTAAASVLCLASCSQDDFAPVQDATENGNVTFTVSLNDKPATRAFGDGTTATELEYAVYDVTEGDAILAGDGKGKFSGNPSTATVSLNLVTNRDYKVVFFATREQNGTNKVYTFDANKKTVKVDYRYTEQTYVQDRDNDCFYKALDIKKEDLGKSHAVILKRPVAQINFATADIDTDVVKAAFGLNDKNEVNVRTKVSGTGYTILNLLDGTVDEPIEFTTEVAAAPISPEHTASPVEGLAYLHCTYVLVPQNEKFVSEVTLNVFKGGIGDNVSPMFDIPVSNVPLQANYRTNIYGNLLTNKTDITITKDEIFEGEYNVDVWNGEIAQTLPAIKDGVMEIASVAALAKVAQEVNSGNSLAGVAIKLTKDLDLNNYEWTPIGTVNNKFQGSFDGGNFTVSNLSIVKTADKNPTGLFGYVDNSPSGLKNVKLEGVKIDVQQADNVEGAGALVGHAFKSSVANISVKDAEIKALHYGAGVAGYIYGNIDNCQAENVVVELKVDSTVDNGDKAGAIAGYCAEAGSGLYTTNNNSAKKVTISGLRDVGGLFGMMQYTRIMVNNTAEDVTLKVNTEGAETILGKIANFGAIVGRWGSDKNGVKAIIGEGNNFTKYTLFDKDNNMKVEESGALTPSSN